ncbi:hypothetical protein ACLOJK_019642 [Asimina triloba]
MSKDNHYDDLLYHLTLYQDTPAMPATVTQELPNSASITTQLSIELTHDTETMLQDFNAPPSSARLRPMPDLMIRAQQIDDDDELHQIRRVPSPTGVALPVPAASSSAMATHHRRKFRWTIQSIQLDDDDELSSDMPRPFAIEADSCMQCQQCLPRRQSTLPLPAPTDIPSRSQWRHRHRRFLGPHPAEMIQSPAAAAATSSSFLSTAYPPSIYPAASGRHKSRWTDDSVHILFVSEGRRVGDERAICLKAFVENLLTKRHIYDETERRVLYVHSRTRWNREKIWRLAIGTAAGGATVAGRRHRDDTRPATGSHNPQAV